MRKVKILMYKIKKGGQNNVQQNEFQRKKR